MRRLTITLLAALAVVACKKQEAAPTPAAPTAAMPAPQNGQQVKGKVVERIDASPYTYLKLAAATGEVWAAVPTTDVKVGEEVTVVGSIEMKDYESPSLKRKFDKVLFGSLGGGAPAPQGMAGAPGMPPPGMGGMPPGMTGGMPDMGSQHATVSQATDVGDVKVAKASGADAKTIAEVYAQSAQLKDKGVTVRGKVVKFNEGIMGRNWLHVRDGTGTQGKDNDLTVTTQDKVAVGDVVLVKGKVSTEKDYGMGYQYPVIVEDAKVSK